MFNFSEFISLFSLNREREGKRCVLNIQLNVGFAGVTFLELSRDRTLEHPHCNGCGQFVAIRSIRWDCWVGSLSDSILVAET